MNKLTIALEYAESNHPLVKQLMDNFCDNKGDSVQVFAMSHGDMFEQIESIEEIIEDYDMSFNVKLELIREILK